MLGAMLAARLSRVSRGSCSYIRRELLGLFCIYLSLAVMACNSVYLCLFLNVGWLFNVH